MKWLDHLFRFGSQDGDDQSAIETQELVKSLLLGIVVPIVILYFGTQAWFTEEAIWFGKRESSNFKVYGDTAKAMGVAYSSVGLYFHFTWLWNMLSFPRIVQVGTVISLFGLLGSLGYAFCSVI